MDSPDGSNSNCKRGATVSNMGHRTERVFAVNCLLISKRQCTRDKKRCVSVERMFTSTKRSTVTSHWLFRAAHVGIYRRARPGALVPCNAFLLRVHSTTDTLARIGSLLHKAVGPTPDGKTTHPDPTLEKRAAVLPDSVTSGDILAKQCSPASQCIKRSNIVGGSPAASQGDWNLPPMDKHRAALPAYIPATYHAKVHDLERKLFGKDLTRRCTAVRPPRQTGPLTGLQPSAHNPKTAALHATRVHSIE